MANDALLLETLEHIKNNPKTWNQGFWFVNYDNNRAPIYTYYGVEVQEVNSCGSAFCFAGHAALKTKQFPAPPKGGWEVAWKNDDGVLVDEFARKALGITFEQANALFAADNSLDDLETLVKAIVDEPEISEHDLWELIGKANECECGCWDDFYDDEDQDDSTY